MRYLLALSLSFFMAFAAHAERKQSYGALDVHYNIFNSTFLQPDTARAVGLNRSKDQAVLNEEFTAQHEEQDDAGQKVGRRSGDLHGGLDGQ